MTALSGVVNVLRWAHDYFAGDKGESPTQDAVTPTPASAEALTKLEDYTRENVHAFRETVGVMSSRLAVIEAKLDNGIAHNLEWLRNTADDHGKILVKVQSGQARLEGLLEARSSQLSGKA